MQQHAVGRNGGASIIRRAAGLVLAAILGLMSVSPVIAAPQKPAASPPAVKIDANGDVHMPAMVVPQSEFLSAAGKAYVAQHLRDMQNPKLQQQTDGVPLLLANYLKREQQLYPVAREDTHIGGVHVVVYTPKGGVAPDNAGRVLINLHGGGFMGCWTACSQLETLPIVSLGGFKVVSVDYRESPGNTFPAASEDVASVYRELLKTYPAKNIGIYGCSAGGMLTGESIAWFQKQGLPMPGAIGMFCSGLTIATNGFGGDAGHIALPLGEARMPQPAPAAPSKKKSGLPYFAGADVTGPLISVANYPEELAKFPPSLIITGTRDFAMSSAIYTHAQLVNAGAESDLHVWDGMFHGFFYNPDVPESKDCFKVIINFFKNHLTD